MTLRKKKREPENKKIKFISAASSGCHWCPADSRISLRTCYVYRSANQWTLKVPLHTRYTSYKVGNGSYPTSVYEGANVFLPLPMQLEIHGKHEKVLQRSDGTFVICETTPTGCPRSRPRVSLSIYLSGVLRDKSRATRDMRTPPHTPKHNPKQQ